MTPSHLRILVDNAQTPDFLILLGATIDHELNEHPECTIEFRQPPSSRYFYESLIGKTLVVRAVGADGSELELFSGILRQVDAEWELNGSCLIALIGIGVSYKRDTLNHSQTFNMTSLQDVATRLLSAEAGDFVCSEPSPLNMLQFNETDWSFLLRVVDRHGGFLRVAAKQVDIYDEFQPASVNLVWRAENGLHVFRSTGKVAPHLLFGANFENATATSRQWDVEIAEVAAEDSLAEIRAGALSGSNHNGLAS